MEPSLIWIRVSKRSPEGAKLHPGYNLLRHAAPVPITSFGVIFGARYSKARSLDRKLAMRNRDTAKLSAKFQISIPKTMRTVRQWKAGQEFAFIPKGEGVLLVPVPRAQELAGLARGAKPRGYRDRADCV